MKLLVAVPFTDAMPLLTSIADSAAVALANFVSGR